MAEQQCSGRCLNDVLVEMGCLSSEDLESQVARKAEETVLSVFHWPKSGTMFWFQEGTRPGPKAMALDMDVDTLLGHGDRRVAQLERVREAFPSNQIVPVRVGPVPTPEEIGDYPSYQIYLAINGARSIAQIALLVHGTEFEVGRRLLALREAGVAEVKDDLGPTLGAREEPAVVKASPSRVEPAAEIVPEIVYEPVPEPTVKPPHEADLAWESPGDFELDFELGSKDEIEAEPVPEDPGVAPIPLAKEAEEEPSPAPLDDTEEHGGDPGELEIELATEPREETAPEAPFMSGVTEEVSVDPATRAAAASQVLEEFDAEQASVEERVDRTFEEVDAEQATAEVKAGQVRQEVDAEQAAAEKDSEECIEEMEAGLHRAREHAEQSRPAEALEELAQVRQADPGHPSISVLRSGAEGAIVEGLLSNGLAPGRIPCVVASAEDLSRVELTPAQEYLIGQANGEWDIQTLLSVAPLRPVELLSALHGLVKRGLVEIQDPAGPEMGS
jgi:hypothetical protein